MVICVLLILAILVDLVYMSDFTRLKPLSITYMLYLFDLFILQEVINF
jgi:hypothetical protein